jgi:ATP-dependent Clp protease protease subunit
MATSKSITPYIYVSGEITTESSALFVAEMRSIEKAKSIVVEINSPGGCIYASLAMTNAIMASKIPVTAYANGMAASCGALIFAAGSKRVMAPLSMVMIHSLSTTFDGNMDRVAKDLQSLQRQNAMFLGFIAKRSGKDLSRLREMLDENGPDLWLSPKQALALGLATEIGYA